MLKAKLYTHIIEILSTQRGHLDDGLMDEHTVCYFLRTKYSVIRANPTNTKRFLSQMERAGMIEKVKVSKGYFGYRSKK